MKLAELTEKIGARILHQGHFTASEIDSFYAGDKMILTASGDEIYGDELNQRWDYLSSREYGSDVIKLIREEGFDRLAYLLKGAQPPADPAAGGMELPPLPEAGGEAPPVPEGGEAPAPECVQADRSREATDS